MKLLITGDRNGFSYDIMLSAIIQYKPDEIIVGDARGVDYYGKLIASRLGIPINKNNNGKPYTANWSQFGSGAGPIRNGIMLDQHPDLVLAFHSNLLESKGTADCIRQAQKRKIKVVIIS